ncbi:MAG: transcriptional repressor LexA [Spirochaetaceae bacterium]|nr:transcriptional repressor LexA [Spirochaetaceae bacterium]
MRKLTNRQTEVLLFISKYKSEHSFSPTYRDVAAHFGFTVKAATDHISALIKKGYLAQQDKTSRTLEILIDIGAVDAQEETPPEMLPVPVLGTIAAGLPIEAIENHEGTIWLPADSLRPGKDYYALHVKGDSMIGAGILDGDLAVIERSEHASNGDIVAAVCNEDGEATLKRFFKQTSRILLQAENPAFPPFYSQDVRIVGRLTTIIRNY